MHYKTILAITDLSTAGNEAVRRAALIAANCRAELRLMYFPADDNPAWPYNESHLAELARSTAGAAGITVKVAARYATSPREIAAEANCADLLVSTYRRGRWDAKVFKGEWHQQVMRLTRCLVLLTRSSGRMPYGKIVVAVDFSKEAPQLVQHASLIDDRAELQLFHAISRADEAKLRSADVSWEVVKAFRARQKAYAKGRLQELARSIDTNGRTLAISMGSGEAARQTSLHQQGSGASLIVVGKHRRSAVMEFVCGSVFSRLLAWSSADVLVVPHDHQASCRAAAKLRIAAERGDGQGGFLCGRRTVQ